MEGLLAFQLMFDVMMCLVPMSIGLIAGILEGFNSYGQAVLGSHLVLQQNHRDESMLRRFMAVIMGSVVACVALPAIGLIVLLFQLYAGYAMVTAVLGTLLLLTSQLYWTASMRTAAPENAVLARNVCGRARCLRYGPGVTLLLSKALLLVGFVVAFSAREMWFAYMVVDGVWVFMLSSMATCCIFARVTAWTFQPFDCVFYPDAAKYSKLCWYLNLNAKP